MRRKEDMKKNDIEQVLYLAKKGRKNNTSVCAHTLCQSDLRHILPTVMRLGVTKENENLEQD